MADTPRPAEPDGRPDRRWRLASAVLGAAVLGLAVTLVLVLVNDDEAQAPTATAPSPATTTSTPTTMPTTTAVPATATVVTATTTTGATTTTPSAGDLAIALWPAPTGPGGYADPVTLVGDFAEQFVGMPSPDVGPYLAGDSRSGEIEVRAEPGAALATTVLVRQLGPSDDWWVIGAASGNIMVDTPQPLAVVASPLALTGSALAFEGTVNVALWEDGATEPLAATFVTGSGAPPPGPFTGELAYGPPGSDGGALVFTSHSGQDGAVIEFAALRVFFT